MTKFKLCVPVFLSLAGCGAPDGISEENIDSVEDALEATSNWSQFARSPRRTSFAEDELTIGRDNVGTLEPAWHLHGDNIQRATIAVWNRRVFLTNPDKRRSFPTTEEYALLSAHDVCDGSEVWQHDGGGQFSGFTNDPAVGHGWLYAQDENRTGAFRVSTGVATTVEGGPGMDVGMAPMLVAGGTRYYESWDYEGGEVTLNATAIPSGLRWKVSLAFPTDLDPFRTPSYANGLVWTVSGETTKLQAYDGATGTLVRESHTVAESLSSASIYKGRVLAAAPNVVYAFNERTGAVSWRGAYSGAAAIPPLDLRYQPPVVDGTGVLVTSGAVGGGVRVAGFDLESGALRFEVTVGTANQTGHPAVANGVLFFGTNDGHLYAVHTETGAVLADYTFSKPVASPAIAYGRIFVAYSGGGPVPLGESGGGLVALALPGAACSTP
jgi:outer membrane protein assembly factor BamB